jgi:endonuclease YncB( thermonuclease family)
MSGRLRADDDQVRLRRVRKSWWIAPLLVTAGCAIEADAGSAVVAGTAEPLATVADRETAEDHDGLWAVVAVIDGDTIRVSDTDGEHTVRLIGIDAPEQGECFYEEATEALRFALGSTGVRLQRDRSDVDRFDRWLRFVESPSGVDIGGELVAAGYARSHRYEPDTARAGVYDELQSQAQDARVGLWATDACTIAGG